MRRLAALLLLLCCFGCSAEVRMRLGSPLDAGEDRVPVFYPAGVGGDPPDPMVQAFGPAWRNMEGDYPAYNFNP